MKTGMGLMELSPSEFWNMTLTEFWAIYNVRFPRKGMTRDELEDLMRKIPD